MGLSLGKFLLLALLLIVVWRGYAYLTALGRSTEGGRVPPRQQPAAKRQERRTIELVECRQCGAYFDPRERCQCQRRGQ